MPSTAHKPFGLVISLALSACAGKSTSMPGSRSANSSKEAAAPGEGAGPTADGKPSAVSTSAATPIAPGAAPPAPGAGSADPQIIANDDAPLDADDLASEDSPPDTREAELILCEEGPKLVQAENLADFQPQFAVICDGSATTKEFKSALSSAYDGTGEPTVTLLSASIDELLTTELTVIYAIKTSLKDPTHIAGLKPHDSFAQGVVSDKSELSLDVVERTTFPPGSASIERVVLDYDIRTAKGAGIYDRRKTEANSYPLSPTRKDVSLGTEHLLDAERNQHYHDAKGLMVAISDGESGTSLVFVSHITAKNRIDPLRIQATFLDLTKATAKVLHEAIRSKSEE